MPFPNDTPAMPAGYDAWRAAGPPDSYDERSECEREGCPAFYGESDEHEPGCPDYQDDEA